MSDAEEASSDYYHVDHLITRQEVINFELKVNDLIIVRGRIVQLIFEVHPVFMMNIADLLDTERGHYFFLRHLGHCRRRESAK